MPPGASGASRWSKSSRARSSRGSRSAGARLSRRSQSTSTSAKHRRDARQRASSTRASSSCKRAGKPAPRSRAGTSSRARRPRSRTDRMVDARVVRIAKLREKAHSTDYPAEAESFRRKALDLMKRHGISEDAVQLAVAEIFGGPPPRRRPAHGWAAQRPAQPRRSAHGPTADQPAERRSMVEAAVWVFEEQDNRPMSAREVWALIEQRGLYMRSRGKTPWATIC